MLGNMVIVDGKSVSEMSILIAKGVVVFESASHNSDGRSS